MIQHTITINLDDEQEAAFTEMVADFNSQNGTNYSNGDFMSAYALGEIGARVKLRYDRAFQELGEAAKALPYAQRQALMAQVAASIESA